MGLEGMWNGAIVAYSKWSDRSLVCCKRITQASVSVAGVWTEIQTGDLLITSLRRVHCEGRILTCCMCRHVVDVITARGVTLYVCHATGVDHRRL